MKYTKKRHNKKRISKKKQYGGDNIIRVRKINILGQRVPNNCSGLDIYAKAINSENENEIYDINTKYEIGKWNTKTNQIDFFEKEDEDEDDYDKIKILKEQIQNNGLLNYDNCVICQEPLFNLYQNNLYIHTCKNMFHTECLKKWCDKKTCCPCPMCKNTVLFV
jgi:hypothetical protein